MSLYSELAITADDLLREFGQSITLGYTTAGGYDPETGTSAETTVSASAVGAVFDFGLHQSGASFSAGSLIVSGDKQLLLSPVGIGAPVPGGTATIGGVTWNIVSVKTTAPAGIAVLYECQLRR